MMVDARNIILEKIKSKASDIEDNNIGDTTLENLNIDSLEFMELIMEIEDDLNISITEEQIDPDLTVSEFIRRLVP
jgi:acyl carrier protein